MFCEGECIVDDLFDIEGCVYGGFVCYFLWCFFLDCFVVVDVGVFCFFVDDDVVDFVWV